MKAFRITAIILSQMVSIRALNIPHSRSEGGFIMATLQLNSEAYAPITNCSII